MATSTHCDLCGQLIPENKKSQALKVFVTPMAERNASEESFFARENWTVDVCLKCAEIPVAHALGIGPLLKGGG